MYIMQKGDIRQKKKKNDCLATFHRYKYNAGNCNEVEILCVEIGSSFTYYEIVYSTYIYIYICLFKQGDDFSTDFFFMSRNIEKVMTKKKFVYTYKFVHFLFVLFLFYSCRLQTIFPYAEQTIPVDTRDIDCSASPTTTCNSNGTSDCTLPILQRSPVSHRNPSCFQIDIVDMRLE